MLEITKDLGFNWWAPEGYQNCEVINIILYH